MMKSAWKFITVGFLIAALEEFITQGVLKNRLIEWIIPTFVAFIPFLFITRFLGIRLDARLGEARGAFCHYLVAGLIGLMVEWFLIGLTPWGMIGQGPLPFIFILQFGMFSFWASVGFAPRLILDRREDVAYTRKWFKRFLILGFLIIYFLTFAVTKQNQFVVSIVAVLTMFITCNLFYRSYIRTLRRSEGVLA